MSTQIADEHFVVEGTIGSVYDKAHDLIASVSDLRRAEASVRVVTGTIRSLLQRIDLTMVVRPADDRTVVVHIYVVSSGIWPTSAIRIAGLLRQAMEAPDFTPSIPTRAVPD